MNQTKKQKNLSQSGLWMAVSLLTVLVLATLALLGTLIMSYVKGDPNVISVMADSKLIAEMYEDKELPPGALPEMQAEDKLVQWETETSVDLFKTEYTGPNGDITVKSSNGDKIIAPGTSNDYYFTLKNTGNISLQYKLILDGVFQIQNKDIPIFVRLKQGDRWIMGGVDSWVYVEEMNSIEEQNTLPHGESVTYEFEWMWPYEMDDKTDVMLGNFFDDIEGYDLHNTELGNLTFDVNADFSLDITVISEIEPGAIAVFDDGSGVFARFILVCASALAALCSGLWLIILWFGGRIYLTGIVFPPVEGKVKLDNKETDMAYGRFIFEKVRVKKHTLTIAGMQTDIDFKRDKDTEAIHIEKEEQQTIVYINPSIKAVELYFTFDGKPTVQKDRWAAIDKDKNVYTPQGKIPAQNNKNRTPAGLTVDENNRYDVEEEIRV